MLRDILRGGPTEIDAINGAIVRVGRQVNVPTPVNHILWQSVKSLEMERDFGLDKESANITKPARRPAPGKRQTTLSTIQQP
jgi:hypothetical protein